MKLRKTKATPPKPAPRWEDERYDNAKIGKVKGGREYLGHDAWRVLDKLELSPRKES